MQRRQFLKRGSAAALALGMPAAFAARDPVADFPSKPIKIIIGFPAGGTQDVLARAVADFVRPALGQALIVENKSGAAGRIAAEQVKHAEPDGHTLLLGTAGMLSLYPSVYRSLSYDPIKDFAPIVQGASFELAMNVHSSVPANNLREFIDWAKANRGQVNFASYGAGTPSQFLGEMLNQATGIDMVHVPYRGSAPARQDLLGGTVRVFFDVVGGTIPYFRAGRVKVLATSGARRSPFLPDVPTFVEQGYPDIQTSAWFSFVAPAKTPKPIIDKLNREFNKALASREVRQQLLVTGMYPIGGTPQELAAVIREDSARWAKVVKAAHFVAQE